MKTKSRFWLCSLLVIGLVLILADSCKKDEVTTEKVTDRDGNVYTSVAIGTQVWMTENLKTTKYNDGSTITNHGNDNIAWLTTTAGAYAWYENNSSNKAAYGALYNGYAVSTEKLCPTGWHVPELDEWLVLINHLGGVDFAGGKLKEKGTAHWLSPNTDATDEFGFKALPGGYRYDSGAFDLMGEQGWWWSSTDNISDPDYSSHVYMDYNESGAFYYSLPKNYGLSVRCLKD